MNELHAFAKAMLRKHGEFHPFGGYLRLNGDVVHVGYRPGVERFDGLVAAMKGSRDEVLAVGVVANVEFSSSAAVRIFLEHRSGYCADVFFPYELLDEGDLLFADHYAQQGVPKVFCR